jgi:photosystem II stability/assembly factor-like uncharacterized protein
MNRLRYSCVLVAIFLTVATLSISACAQQYEAAQMKALKWRLVGPFRGGRVLAVTGIPGDPYTFYFGGVAGGVWRTTDGGISWTPLTDSQPFASIGAIAVSDSNHSVIYVGTGESCIRGNISYGNGVYKSTDGGKSWTYAGLKDTQHIARVLIDPRNSNIVYVAALGHAYGPNPERGVYRSLDGGKTWERILYKDEKTGAIDLDFDPHNPNVMFAAMYQVQRTPWSLDSGGPGSGLYRSVDGGNTWKHLEGHGLPEGILGRIGVSVSGADSNRVYALIEAKEGGLFRSDDGGDTWTKVNDDQRMTQRAWYFTHIFADPQNADTVYILNTGMFRSNDGGRTLQLLPAPHGDHHALWIDPTDPKRMINGNDGGATISFDGGRTWSSQYTQPTAQFYHVAADNRFLYYLYGAQQDNSTVAIASRTDDGYIGRQHWYDVGGGESGYIVPDPRDPDIVYAGSGGGVITRFDKRTQQEQDITVWPQDSSGHGAADTRYRQAWTDPIAMSPFDPDVLYTGAEVVFKSTDHGMSWTAISPDLTRNDKSKQQSSGGPITKDNTTVEYYDTVFTIAESPVQKDLIWAGTDDGLIQLTRDGGKHWTNVTPKGIPEWSLVSLIEASPHDAGTAYAAVDAHKLDDLKPYIFKTTDFGKTWSMNTTGIPEGSYVHAVREDPVEKNLLFAGTEMGVYASFDGGGHWTSIQNNLPTSPIHDLIVKNDDLAVATHGRSFWILDDITPLRQLGKHSASEEMILYKPHADYRLRWPEEFERRQPVAPNPPSGALISYYLSSAPKANEEVKLDILDSHGKVVREYSSLEKKKAETPPEWPDLEPPQEKLPVQVGLNRFAWDLRYEPAHELPGEVGAEYRNRGPEALPGNYEVRLTANGKSQTVPLEIKQDPRVKVSMAELQKQFDLEMKIRDQLSALHDTVAAIRTTRLQFHTLQTRLSDNPRFKNVLSAGEALDKKMTPIEDQLLQVNIKSSEASLNYPVLIDDQLHGLFFSVDVADAPPTQQQYAVFDELSKQATPLIAEWKQIMSTDVVALNEMMRKDNVPAIYLAPPEGEQQGAKAAGGNQQ